MWKPFFCLTQVDLVNHRAWRRSAYSQDSDAPYDVSSVHPACAACSNRPVWCRIPACGRDVWTLRCSVCCWGKMNVCRTHTRARLSTTQRFPVTCSQTTFKGPGTKSKFSFGCVTCSIPEESILAWWSRRRTPLTCPGHWDGLFQPDCRKPQTCNAKVKRFSRWWRRHVLWTSTSTFCSHCSSFWSQ